jgi:hypothetical protein
VERRKPLCQQRTGEWLKSAALIHIENMTQRRICALGWKGSRDEALSRSAAGKKNGFVAIFI